MNKINWNGTLIVAMILGAAMCRLLPHPPNFTPIAAMGLFGAAYFERKGLAFLVPMLALYLSDLVINNIYYPNPNGFSFTSIYPITYLGFGAVIVLGFIFLHEVTFGRVVYASAAASTAFFLITNFAVWLGSNTYPPNGAGLVAAYVAGIPFYANSLVGDLFFSGLLFGGYALAKRLVPAQL